jgi:hypothetical protein
MMFHRGCPMTLILSFPPEVESRLRELAAAAGKDVESVVREAVEEKLAGGHRNGSGTGANGTAATFRDLVGLMRSLPPAG